MNNLKENIEHIGEHGQEYFGKELEYYRLKMFKKLMKGATASVNFIIVGAFVFWITLMMSIAGAFLINIYLDNNAVSFVLIGIIYVVMLVLFLVFFRKRLERRILRAASEEFFD